MAVRYAPAMRNELLDKTGRTHTWETVRVKESENYFEINTFTVFDKIKQLQNMN